VTDRTTIHVDLWLYGALARYGGGNTLPGSAHCIVELPVSGTMGDLLALLALPAEERGITFINGELSAMPGVQPDLAHVLNEGDRVGLFDTKGMWPFQYRQGAAMIDEMAGALSEDDDQGLHHSYGGESA
jgi:hypothetical protein